MTPPEDVSSGIDREVILPSNQQEGGRFVCSDIDLLSFFSFTPLNFGSKDNNYVFILGTENYMWVGAWILHCVCDLVFT